MDDHEKIDLLNGEPKTNLKVLSTNYLATKFGFTFLGISGMLIYNLYLQELGYFNATLGSNFALWGTMVYGISNNFGQLLSIVFGRSLSFGGRIIWSCAGLAISVICIAIVTLLKPPGGFEICLFMTLILGISGAVHQSASCGLAGAISGEAMNYMSLGQALAGLFGWPVIFAIEVIFSHMGVSQMPSFLGEPSPAESMTVLVTFIFGAIFTICFIPYYIVEMSSEFELPAEKSESKIPRL